MPSRRADRPLERNVEVRAEPVSLAGIVVVPSDARGVAVLAHASAAARLSPRTRYMADVLARDGLASLSLDLLAGSEADDIDVDLLGERLVAAIDWLAEEAAIGDLPRRLADVPFGCFGPEVAAAAALIAAAARPQRVAAIVSAGGRPDLAGAVLSRVVAPTLFVVGARDARVLELNRRARARLAGESDLEVLPDVGHLFEERGAFTRVMALTRDWFVRHLDAARERPTAAVR